MSTGETVGMVIGAALMATLSGGAAIWLQRYTQRNLAPRESPLPQAKIHDGRTFGRQPLVGGNRPAMWIAGFYIALLWWLALMSVIGAACMIALATSSGS